jgi:uncharacterized pyridoxamine 5'-phosphate oxidase family protein
MGKLNDFLTDAGMFYLATADGNRPKVRPLGLHLAVNGKVVFGVGDFKDVYAQMSANPYVEIVAVGKDSHWLRFSGRAVFETDPKYEEMALEAIPHLRSIYNKETGHKLAMFHLEDAKAFIIPVMGEGTEIPQD